MVLAPCSRSAVLPEVEAGPEGAPFTPAVQPARREEPVPLVLPPRWLPERHVTCEVVSGAGSSWQHCGP